LKPGDLEEADVVDLAHDGRGIARVDGKAVFIDGALPGERVRFRVLKRRRHLDEAGLVEVLVPSPDRVVPRCAHFGVCGGCSLQHLAPAAQLAAKERQLLDNLERIGGVRPECVLPPLRGSDWAYRRRARLGVKYVHKKGRVLAGFRERQSPYLADIRRCEILLGRFADLPAQLAALVETLSIREKVPQVELAAGDERSALVFRVMEAPSTDDLARLAAFGGQNGVQIYLQSGGLESIRPLTEPALPLSYALDGGLTLEFGPADFIQINREVNIAMVRSALDRTIRYWTYFAAWATSRCPWRSEPAGPWASREMRRCSARRRPMPGATASKMPTSSRKICSNRRTLAHGPEIPTIWCFSIRRVPGRLKSWNAWHSGGRDESCIFPVIQGVWRAMRGSWCRPKGSA
jgi:tRNA/tmRNA/rRNA uracil-C5-methylase (TrmA/RlmC/RlmD family)